MDPITVDGLPRLAQVGHGVGAERLPVPGFRSIVGKLLDEMCGAIR
jgi:hypothetical protein